MRWSYLGRVKYRAALALQEALRRQVLEGGPETLVLLEHDPVITLGRSANAAANVLISPAERERRGVELVPTGRGGDVTFHGPGQLVGYPIRRVGRAVRPHVEGMAQTIVELLGRLGIESWWTDDHPGVWTAAGKIAAVGVDARGGVTMHGFALNVTTDLTAYRMIVPCGLQAPVTSIAALLGQTAAPPLADLARDAARGLARRYDAEIEEVPPSALQIGGEV